MGGPKPKPKPKQDSVVVPDPAPVTVATPTTPRKPLGHELSPKDLEAESLTPQAELDPDDGIDSEPAADDVDVADDDDAFIAPEPPFTWSISKRDPRIVFVPITAKREKIATELETTPDLFVPVGDMEAMPSSPDQQGIRFIQGSRVPTKVLVEMQKQFDAQLSGDVKKTVDALVAQTGGWSASQYFLRWSQYSGYKDGGGDDYFDDYIEELQGHIITTTEHHLISSDTMTEKNGVDELLAQSSGDVHAAVLRARARSGKHAESDDSAFSATGELPLGHVVGRYITGSDTSGVAAQIAQVLVGPVRWREEAEIRTRNAAFVGGAKVMICDGESWWGYGIVFDTMAASVGSMFPPVVGSTEEDGRFYWYYPSTFFFGAGENDPNGPTEQPATEDIEQEILHDALDTGTSESIVALDFGALRQASLDERVRMFTLVVNVGFDKLDLHGYTAADAADALARVIMTMPPGDLKAFTAALSGSGVLKKLIETHDARLAPIGQAFTFQALASTDYGASAFEEPTKLTQGSDAPDEHLDYYQATAHDPANAGDPTTISFEYGSSGTAWGDTDPWTMRSRTATRAFAPTELISVESVSEKGRSLRIVSAFEAALTQGDPEGEVHGKTFWSFMDMVMLLEGGSALMRLGELGLKAAATGSLRMALKLAAEELATQTGKAAVRGVVDFALYEAARYAQAHEEELQKTPEGRAFLAILTTATVLLAARDIGALIESGAITKLASAGRAALGVVTGKAAQAIAKTVDTFKAAGIAWSRLDEEGALLVTTVGGITRRQPRSLADLTNAFSVARAEVAGTRLLGSLAEGSAEKAGATTVLDELEKAAGGFKRGKGATPPGEAEVAAGDAYRHLATYAQDLAPAEQQKLFEALKKLFAGRGKRSIAELSPFITAGVRELRAGVDTEAYFAAVGQLANRSGLTREGFARLAANAVGKNPVDLVWLAKRDLTDADLDFLAIDTHTKWKVYRDATAVGASAKDIIRANTQLRGVAAEMVARDEASTLVPGFEVEGRQVETPGGSEIDFTLKSTDRLKRIRPLEVKGWGRDTWKKAFDAFAPEHGNPDALLLDSQRGVTLPDPITNSGLRKIEGMIDQLRDAQSLATGGKPILAVTDALKGPERKILERILADNKIDAEIVYLSESKILATGRRLGIGFGWR
jgi:hypothetical protein